MRVAVIGGGGREQAIAWACRRHGHRRRRSSTRTSTTSTSATTDLVIPGPEAALAAGAADRCAELGVPCFGPPAALAALESSKGFARDAGDVARHPGPGVRPLRRPATSTARSAWWRELGRPVVVKLDGLAAGKGVTVPDDDAETEAAIRAAAAAPFVLEERMTGPECSLLALCDGRTAVALPLAQDHKRIGEGDTGPNTGGMGAYAPAPVPYDADELLATFVQPVLDHFAAAGTPYVGVLYAGLMLTADGPRLVEYNVRFGDPEAQAVLPLLRTDLAALALAATQGDITAVPLEVDAGAACTVVAAAAGYPASPRLGDPVLTTTAARWASAASSDGARCSRPGSPTASRPAGGCSPSPGSAPTSAAARDAAYAAMDGDLVRRACRCAATSAGGRRAPSCAPTPRPASTSTRATGPSPS